MNHIEQILANSVYEPSDFSQAQIAALNEMFDMGIAPELLNVVANPALNETTYSVLADYLLKSPITQVELNRYLASHTDKNAIICNVYLAKLHGMSDDYINIFAKREVPNLKLARLLVEKVAKNGEDPNVISPMVTRTLANGYLRNLIQDFLDDLVPLDAVAFASTLPNVTESIYVFILSALAISKNAVLIMNDFMVKAGNTDLEDPNVLGRLSSYISCYPSMIIYMREWENMPFDKVKRYAKCFNDTGSESENIKQLLTVIKLVRIDADVRDIRFYMKNCNSDFNVDTYESYEISRKQAGIDNIRAWILLQDTYKNTANWLDVMRVLSGASEENIKFYLAHKNQIEFISADVTQNELFVAYVRKNPTILTLVPKVVQKDTKKLNDWINVVGPITAYVLSDVPYVDTFPTKYKDQDEKFAQYILINTTKDNLQNFVNGVIVTQNVNGITFGEAMEVGEKLTPQDNVSIPWTTDIYIGFRKRNHLDPTDSVDDKDLTDFDDFEDYDDSEYDDDIDTSYDDQDISAFDDFEDDAEGFVEHMFVEDLNDTTSFTAKQIDTDSVAILLRDAENTKMCQFNKQGDDYVYRFEIEHDGDVLEYSKTVATKEDVVLAIKRSMKMIDKIPAFRKYVTDLQEVLDKYQ